jgi:Zn-dependent peptidase ImmA (M78 family)
MAKEGIPINPKVLEWARTRAGLSLEDAAKKFARIAEWESGDLSPTYSQLEQLADALKLPLAVFFFPEPPKTVPIRESFRTLPDVEFNRIPSRVGYLLRKAKALQLNLPELAEGGNPAPRLITRDLAFKENTSIETMAARVREYLDVSLEDQYAWSDDDTALKAWRRALQAAGVFVFKDAFKSDGYSGFSLYDDLFPIIYVNNSSTKTRQMFTLFHELAHLLFHTSGIDTIKDSYIPSLPSRERKIEVMCNEFAARFLVPQKAFVEAVKGSDHSEQTAEMLAARFHVSREVIFRMFLDRQWIDQAEYAEAARRWTRQKQAGSGGGNPYWTQISYLGRDYIELALKQYYQNRIDDVRLAEYLNMKPKNLGVLEDYFARAPQ